MGVNVTDKNGNPEWITEEEFRKRYPTTAEYMLSNQQGTGSCPYKSWYEKQQDDFKTREWFKGEFNPYKHGEYDESKYPDLIPFIPTYPELLKDKWSDRTYYETYVRKQHTDGLYYLTLFRYGKMNCVEYPDNTLEAKFFTSIYNFLILGVIDPTARTRNFDIITFNAQVAQFILDPNQEPESERLEKALNLGLNKNRKTHEHTED